MSSAAGCDGRCRDGALFGGLRVGEGLDEDAADDRAGLEAGLTRCFRIVPVRERHARRRLVDKAAQWPGENCEVGRVFGERRGPDQPVGFGVVGLVLVDTVAPGYGNEDVHTFGTGRSRPDGWDLGYTPALRLAFLRQEGYDPLDLPPPSFGASFNPFGNVPPLDLPFFPDPPARTGLTSINGSQITEQNVTRSAGEKWRRLRADASDQFLARLRAALPPAAPPVLVDDRFDPPAERAWFVRWDRPSDPLPRRTNTWLPIRDEPPPGRPGALRCVSVAATGREVAGYAAFALRRPGPGWTGVVLDLSRLPFERAASFLGDLCANAALR